MFKIATFNANSLRSRLKIVLDWLQKESPDVLCIQETKVQDAEFPREAIESAGWNVVFRGQKSYNGVAIISKKPVSSVCMRLYPDVEIEDARFICAETHGIRIINTYIPQGFLIDSPKFEYKLRYFSDLKKYFAAQLNPKMPALWMGDLNVAPTEIDLARPKNNEDHVCFHPEARRALKEAMDGLWIDLFREKEKGPGHYTYWDYRVPSMLEKNIGWRIDHMLGTPVMVPRLHKIWVDKEPRKLEKPSDHTFLIAEFTE